MPYDSDSRTIEWFAAALASAHTRTRLRAVELLRDVDGPLRGDWLREASNDPEPEVSAMAVVLLAAIECGALGVPDELFESDFAEGAAGGELDWEWEYTVVVCRGSYLPTRGVVVWTRDEDDAEAKRLGVLKACTGQRSTGDETPLLVGKRFVNRYTRSPRSFTEAMKWHRHGRPRFGGQ